MPAPADRSVTPVDGRRARRERNRQKVIDAVFLLIQDGKVPPTVEDVARRAGVSVSSVFRNFDGLGDLQRHAFDRFHDRFAVLLDAAPPAGADRPARIRHHVDTRIELCSRAGQLMQLARHRALDHQPIADGVARLRSRLADQAGRHFADEASRLAPADAAALLALIDAATSPEVFELMRAAHACSSRQIARTWTTALAVLLDGWPTLASTGAPTASEEHP